MYCVAGLGGARDGWCSASIELRGSPEPDSHGVAGAGNVRSWYGESPPAPPPIPPRPKFKPDRPPRLRMPMLSPPPPPPPPPPEMWDLRPMSRASRSSSMSSPARSIAREWMRCVGAASALRNSYWLFLRRRYTNTAPRRRRHARTKPAAEPAIIPRFWEEVIGGLVDWRWPGVEDALEVVLDVGLGVGEKVGVESVRALWVGVVGPDWFVVEEAPPPPLGEDVPTTGGVDVGCWSVVGDDEMGVVVVGEEEVVVEDEEELVVVVVVVLELLVVVVLLEEVVVVLEELEVVLELDEKDDEDVDTGVEEGDVEEEEGVEEGEAFVEDGAEAEGDVDDEGGAVADTIAEGVNEEETVERDVDNEETVESDDLRART